MAQPQRSRSRRPARMESAACIPVAASTTGNPVLIGGSFSWIASSDPDGLEWSIAKTGGRAELEPASDGLHRRAAAIQEKTAVIPDYNTTFAGIVGSGAILLAVFGASCLFRAGQRQE